MPTVLFLLSTVLPIESVSGSVQVVYPKPGQVVTAVDSTFIFGNLLGGVDPDDCLLVINNEEVRIHSDGGWLAFLPVTPGDFVFDVRLFNRDNRLKEPGAAPPIAAIHVPVRIPEPIRTLPCYLPQIAGDYRPPRGDIVLASGDRLHVMFRGTPGLQAWFSIPDLVDSVPMTETAPHNQPYWGESVFGAGAVPDSVKVGGIYSGFFAVTDTVSALDKPVVYHLVHADIASVVVQLLQNPFSPNLIEWLRWLHPKGEVSLESSYLVSMNLPAYPFAVRFTDSVQIIRHGPRKGYFSIFQPEGVTALAVGAEGEWYKVRLSATQYAWVNLNSVEPLEKGILPPKSYLTSIRTYGSNDDLVVEFPLAGKHPFRIVEDDKRTIRIQLFGVTGDTDWIRYDFSDPLVNIATWSQPEPDLYELTVTTNEDIWGYDAYYVGNTFYFQLNKPPSDVRWIKGKRIVIDPGHSADPGAIGPTGLTEAEANLGIALVVAKILRTGGAEVILTRDDDSDIPLYDRPAIAKAHDADLFVSIHNNALPDGVNPFTNNGVSTYYYHPHSIELARSIQSEMIKATGLPDHGLFYGNLAVNRPTQYPAVLVECAFMMIPEQEAMLKTDRFRRKVAWAIVRGISGFLKGYDDGR